MTTRASLPFIFKRSTDRFGAEIVSTVETFQGLVHLDGDRLVVQWRVARNTDRFGKVIGSEREVGDVREVVVPLSAIAAAVVRRRGFLGGRECVLIASDLGGFAALAGADALALDHPAEFTIPVRRADRVLAEEFAADLALALAEREAAAGRIGPGGAPAPLSAGTGTTP